MSKKKEMKHNFEVVKKNGKEYLLIKKDFVTSVVKYGFPPALIISDYLKKKSRRSKLRKVV